MMLKEVPDEVRADILRNGSDAAVFSLIAESLFQELESATAWLSEVAYLAETGNAEDAAAMALSARQRIGDMLLKAAALWGKRGYPWRKEYGLKEH